MMDGVYMLHESVTSKLPCNWN